MGKQWGLSIKSLFFDRLCWLPPFLWGSSESCWNCNLSWTCKQFLTLKSSNGSLPTILQSPARNSAGLQLSHRCISSLPAALATMSDGTKLADTSQWQHERLKKQTLGLPGVLLHSHKLASLSISTFLTLLCVLRVPVGRAASDPPAANCRQTPDSRLSHDGLWRNVSLTCSLCTYFLKTGPQWPRLEPTCSSCSPGTILNWFLYYMVRRPCVEGPPLMITQ